MGMTRTKRAEFTESGFGDSFSVQRRSRESYFRYFRYFKPNFVKIIGLQRTDMNERIERSNQEGGRRVLGAQGGVPSGERYPWVRGRLLLGSQRRPVVDKTIREIYNKE